MKKTCALVCLFALFALPALALDVSPLQVAIWGPDVQLCDQSTEIWGLRLNLPYGISDHISGFDIGIYGRAVEANAFQFNFVNRVGALKGAQIAIFNMATDDMHGGQIGLYNNVIGNGYGFQLGLFNVARDFSGVQFGLFNRCTSILGVQVGLINIIDESDFPFFPIVNGAF